MFLNLKCRILFHAHFDHLKNSLVFGLLLFSWWTKGIFAAHYSTLKHSYFRRLCVHIWSEREKMSECWARSIDIDIGTGNDWRCPLIKTSPSAGKNHHVNKFFGKDRRKIWDKFCAIALFYSNYQTFWKTQKLQRMTAMLPLSS